MFTSVPSLIHIVRADCFPSICTKSDLDPGPSFIIYPMTSTQLAYE